VISSVSERNEHQWSIKHAKPQKKKHFGNMCRGGRGDGGQWVMPVRHFSDKR
jgi:hypothetical protein